MLTDHARTHGVRCRTAARPHPALYASLVLLLLGVLSVLSKSGQAGGALLQLEDEHLRLVIKIIYTYILIRI